MVNIAETQRRVLRMLLRDVKVPRDWSRPLLISCTDVGTETGCYIPFVGRKEVFDDVRKDLRAAGYNLRKVTISSRVHYEITRLSKK